MCDLLGMSFSSEVHAGISLDLFQERGKENPDGWGLAFYRDQSLQIIKEAISATRSPLFDFMERHMQSDTFLSHVRRSTRGVSSYVNTHPFYRVVIINGVRREFAFAHNGTLTSMDILDPTDMKPLGTTDSELLFCYLLEQINRRGIAEWGHDAFKFIEGEFRRLNTPENTMNCIFSDGEYLFCYSDENRHNGGLRYVPREHPFDPLDFIEDGRRLGSVDIRSANISDTKPTRNTGHIIVTRVLNESDWREFNPGQLIVFKRGVLVYSG